MTNQLFPLGRQGFLGGDIDWDANNIRADLLSSAYTYSAAHDFRDDLAGLIAQSGLFVSKTTTNGTADAADVTWTAVAGGSTVRSIVIYQDTGVNTTSRLIAFLDTHQGGSINVVTNGGDITAQWSASGIFVL